MIRRIGYPHIVSTLALVVALAGSGFAVAGAVHLPKSSVASKQIKNGAIKAKDVKPGTLTGAQVADGTLTGADIDESSLSLPAAAAVKEGPSTGGTMQSVAVATLASVTFTASKDGYVLVSGGASFGALVANTYVRASLYQDNADLGDCWWDPGDADGFTDQHQTTDAVAAVTAGSHTFSLRGYDILPSGTSHAGYNEAHVVVEFFPAGG